jgi:hypothetical protein
LIRVCGIQLQASHFEGLDDAKVIAQTKAAKLKSDEDQSEPGNQDCRWRAFVKPPAPQ